MSVDPPRSDAEAFAYLLGLVGRGALIRVAGWMILASATEGIGLLLLVPITQIVAGTQLPGTAGELAAPLVALPLGALLGGFVALVAVRAAIMYRVRAERAALGLLLTRRLRNEVQQAVMGADWRWLSGERSGTYGAMVVGQAERLGSLVDQAIQVVTTSITAFALLATAMWLAWDLTLLTLAMTAVFAVASLAFRREKTALGNAYSDAYTDLQNHVTDGLAHLRAARIAGAQDVLTRDFDNAIGRLEKVELDYQRTVRGAELAMQVVTAAILAVLVWVGLRLLATPLGIFIPVLAIFLRIAPLATALQQGWRSWRYCQPALAQLMETVLSARLAAEPVLTAGEPLPFTGAIDIDCVTIRYEGRAQPVLAAFSQAIPHGAVVAVTGPSGSGKSTLADLLSGLIAPDAGEIRVDGRTLDGEARIRWRSQVAYVEQTPFLIDGSIADNLTWGLTDVSHEAMERALHEASAEFVLALPRGLDTLVGERGRELSGGERQRISLARALLRRPSLIILDEVTAALDPRNEDVVAQTIAAKRGACTFVILGHRPALNELADMQVQLGRAHD